jgi:hypothetical protein
MGQIQTAPAAAAPSGGGAPQSTVLRRTATQNMGTATRVIWQAADRDDLALWNGTTLLIVPAALAGGLIVLSACIAGTGVNGNDPWGVVIEMSGLGPIASDIASSPPAPARFVATPPMVVAEGDAFSCRGQSAGASWVLGGLEITNFSAIYWPPA